MQAMQTVLAMQGETPFRFLRPCRRKRQRTSATRLLHRLERLVPAYPKNANLLFANDGLFSCNGEREDEAERY